MEPKEMMRIAEPRKQRLVHIPLATEL